MNRTLGLIAAILSIVVLAGCAPKSAAPANASAGAAAPNSSGNSTSPVTANPSAGNSNQAAGTQPGDDAEPAPAAPTPLEVKAGTGGWCDAGQIYRDAATEYKVTGLVPFKGKTYCEAVVTTDKGTNKMYWTEGHADEWIVGTVNGQTQEFHVPNGN